MKNKLPISMLLILSFLVAYFLYDGVTSRSNVAYNVPCPSWTREKGSCNLKVGVSIVAFTQEVKFGEYTHARITVTGSDALVNEAENVQVFTEAGEEVNFTQGRLLVGTYYFVRVDPNRASKFSITNPYRDAFLRISMEFLKPSN